MSIAPRNVRSRPAPEHRDPRRYADAARGWRATPPWILIPRRRSAPIAAEPDRPGPAESSLGWARSDV